jgi:hypothetical protein
MWSENIPERFPFALVHGTRSHAVGKCSSRPGFHCSGAKAVSFTQNMVTSVTSEAAIT